MACLWSQTVELQLCLYSLDLQDSHYSLWCFNAREACTLDSDQILDPKGHMKASSSNLLDWSSYITYCLSVFERFIVLAQLPFFLSCYLSSSQKNEEKTSPLFTR